MLFFAALGIPNLSKFPSITYTICGKTAGRSNYDTVFSCDRVMTSVSFLNNEQPAVCQTVGRFTSLVTGTDWCILFRRPIVPRGACPRKGVIDLTIVKVEDVPSEMEPFPRWMFTELQRSLHRDENFCNNNKWHDKKIILLLLLKMAVVFVIIRFVIGLIF